jgi:hypothetical protein
VSTPANDNTPKLFDRLRLPANGQDAAAAAVVAIWL